MDQVEMDDMLEIFVDQLNEMYPEGDFQYMDGRRFYRVHQGPADEQKVYCFIEKKTGDAYYPANWKAPAPGGPRGNISTAEGMVAALDQCTPINAFAKR